MIVDFPSSESTSVVRVRRCWQGRPVCLISGRSHKQSAGEWPLDQWIPLLGGCHPLPGPMDPPAGMVSSGQIVKIYVNMVPTEVSRNFWFQGRDSLQTWSENPPAATSCVFNWEAKPPAAHWFPHPPKNPGSLGDGRHRPRGALGANATLSGHDVTNMDQLWINNSLHRTLHAWHWASVWAVTWVCLEYSTAKSHD